MSIKSLILVSFFLGFIAGWNNDRVKQNFYGKNTIFDHLFMIPTILFILYSFWLGLNLGFIVILEIMLGSYIGVKSNRLLKKIFKSLFNKNIFNKNIDSK